MKKLLLSFTALVLSTVLFAQTTEGGKKSDDVAKIKSETIDLGKIKQDNPTTAVFEVINISKENLIIEQANPTCGCTISDYTKDKIAPGEMGYIKATYNAKNVGMFEKHLTVKFAGCDDMKSITIKGEVLKNEEASAPKTESTPSSPTVDAAPTKTSTPTKAPTKITRAPKNLPKKAAVTPVKP